MLFIAPMAIVGAGVLIGSRGPFRRFHDPPIELELSTDGLRVRPPGKPERFLAWNLVGGVAIVGYGDHATQVYGGDGRPIDDLPDRWVGATDGRRITIPELLIGIRPDRYVALDPRRPRRGCILRAAAA